MACTDKKNVVDVNDDSRIVSGTLICSVQLPSITVWNVWGVRYCDENCIIHSIATDYWKMDDPFDNRRSFEIWIMNSFYCGQETSESDNNCLHMACYGIRQPLRLSDFSPAQIAFSEMKRKKKDRSFHTSPSIRRSKRRNIRMEKNECLSSVHWANSM